MPLDTATSRSVTPPRRCRKKGRVKRMHTVASRTSKGEQQDLKTPEINAEDDLGLEFLEVPDVPQDMLFPGEYNAFLKERLKNLSEENKQLSACTRQQEEELENVRSKLLSLETKSHNQESIHEADSSHYVDMAACRVMDLTKQVCELTAQLEDQRTRCSLAESKLLSVVGSHEERIPADLLNRKEAEVRTLNEKLHSTSTKLYDCRNKVQQLQQDLKIAHKVLACEVGDGVVITDLIANGGISIGWRGRSQQIQLLQQRVAELSDRLKKFHDHHNESKLLPLNVVKQSERDKRSALEAVQEEARSTNLHLLENTRKLDAARARVKVLESELNSFKSRLQILSDKGSRDDQLINVLQCQVNQLEGRLRHNKDEAQMEIRKVENYQHQLAEDLRLEKQRCIQAMSTLEDKDQQINRLEKLLFDFRDGRDTKPDCVCDSKPNIEEQNGSSNAVASQPEIRSSIKMHLERKKLLELVGVINTRLNDARHESDKQKSALRLERQRFARLETKMARQEQERMSYRHMACNARKASATTGSAEENNPSKDELLDKLEILQEEVLTLRTRLACVEQEKEDDLRRFSAILDGTAQRLQGGGSERVSSPISLIPKRSAAARAAGTAQSQPPSPLRRSASASSTS